MEKLEHIGIAVKNLEKSNQLFARLLGKQPYKTEDVPSEGVRTSFFEVGGVKIELLEATRADSPIANFIEKRGEGLHHLAFAVNNIEDRMKDMEQAEFRLLAERPKNGADNKKIVFLHPKTTNHVLVEMCEDRMDRPTTAG
ncbi:MAG TPA: methylmalonyl-CoA epimerase [Cyclobacteriaceae bacterium]|nr:methylmalonyl-CoA epimerase [Cyclobacteriaceae bacterium]